MGHDGRAGLARLFRDVTARPPPPALDAAAHLDFAAYRPRLVVEAVNALWPLGREAALAALDAQLARHDPQADAQDGLLLVLRVLFEVPDPPGYQPALPLGGTVPLPPPDPRTLPHFPLVLVDDWPLLLVTGFVLAGDVAVATAVAQFRATGVLRKRPLAPGQAMDAVLAQWRLAYANAYGQQPSARLLAWTARQLQAG